MQTTTTEIKDGPLALTITTLGSTRTVTARGELDLSNVQTLEDLLGDLERDGAEVIVLDLEALEFIDSSGLALLINTHKHLNRDGRGCLRIVPAQAVGVQRVLAATGLDTTLPFIARTQTPA